MQRKANKPVSSVKQDAPNITARATVRSRIYPRGIFGRVRVLLSWAPKYRINRNKNMTIGLPAWKRRDIPERPPGESRYKTTLAREAMCEEVKR